MKDECTPRMTAEPDAAYLPILTAAVVLLSMATLWYIIKGIGKRVVAGRLYARYFAREDNELGSETRVLTTEASVPRSPTRSRLRSLDIFRGIAIALMFVVQTKQASKQILPRCVERSDGGGLGIPMVRVHNGGGHGVVPQRQAEDLAAEGQRAWTGRSLFRDIAAGWQQWLATVLMVAIQLCITLTVAAPGCPVGYSGPGGLHRTATGDFSLQNCTGGIAGYIDR
ncbi:hypothetical protein KGM_201918 [Danaus plexippus plexippus]|uniref:Uncharacterized protein n=1 Tax=Danaus plexippus plexippus TaxID=278856 RepID=A0A212FJX5_DANPL|nr:hypothetical protein KGM_201918 [Danaus plexippus plexippus]